LYRRTARFKVPRERYVGMGRRLSDPAWKSGPTEPEPSASEHAIHPEDFGSGFDFDGFGVDEAEQVEGEPLVTIQEVATCSRDGCDAAHRRRLLFTTHTLTDAEEDALHRDAGLSDGAVLAEYVHEHAERVDVETIEVDGTHITAEQTIEDEPHGACYGRVEPEPDVHAHKYDL
jgi:hypothetical protein